MKYIRTKDGRVIEATKIQETFVLGRGEVVGYIKASNSAIGEIPKDKILKISDTIEELCDYKVLIYKNEEPRIIYMPIKDIIDRVYYTEIYGAIWTDKGLIYEAKLNEKGELELL